MKAFQAKLKPFENSFLAMMLDDFPVIARTNRKEIVQNFVKCISESQCTFNEYFGDFSSQEQKTAFVTQPFSVEDKDALALPQMELIDVKWDEFINKKFDKTSSLKFYRNYVTSDKFFQLKKMQHR